MAPPRRVIFSTRSICHDASSRDHGGTIGDHGKDTTHAVHAKSLGEVADLCAKPTWYETGAKEIWAVARERSSQQPQQSLGHLVCRSMRAVKSGNQLGWRESSMGRCWRCRFQSHLHHPCCSIMAESSIWEGSVFITLWLQWSFTIHTYIFKFRATFLQSLWAEEIQPRILKPLLNCFLGSVGLKLNDHVDMEEAATVLFHMILLYQDFGAACLCYQFSWPPCVISKSTIIHWTGILKQTQPAWRSNWTMADKYYKLQMWTLQCFRGLSPASKPGCSCWEEI